ncbi:17239_t:CDS:1 [Racocetra fulgida]|uniref:17239_t:CDS:1 n=1 Tax=Racocetra fulgida TaxID=60492 RepID=A0A9N9CC84_9GLOM|nr:17239_t:CDS:1 [Racocetra fulgida]
MRFYENGNLYQYLDDAMGYLCWRDIVDMLWGIANGLERIHEHGLYHGNLHGGNLLVENEPESIDTRIADVGLHGPPSRSKNSINYGVLPFIAPEVLKGKEYTQASDIYSFGIIMWMLSSCIRPFCQVPHDSELAMKICNGYRPEIVDGTPEVFSTLMKRCWDNDPLKRPKASELSDILGCWVTAICDDPDPSQISEQFDEAEEKKFLELEKKQFKRPEVHPLAIYNSQFIRFPVS